MREVEEYCARRTEVVRMLVGNKIDRLALRQVATEDARNWASKHGLVYVECSAKSRDAATAVFTTVVNKVMTWSSVEINIYSVVTINKSCIPCALIQVLSDPMLASSTTPGEGSRRLDGEALDIMDSEQSTSRSFSSACCS